MIIKAETTLALTFGFSALTTDVTPVIIAEQQRDVIRHGETGIIVALHLGEDSPELWYGILTSVDILDNLTLPLDDVL